MQGQSSGHDSLQIQLNVMKTLAAIATRLWSLLYSPKRAGIEPVSEKTTAHIGDSKYVACL